MTQGSGEKHWYDGAFYARMVDPWLAGVRGQICSLVESDAEVLDVGCGTGALAVQLAPRCRRVMGVDVSEKMVSFARRRAADRNLDNVTIHHADALEVPVAPGFDYAVASLVLHALPERQREALVKHLAAVASTVIVADYPARDKERSFGLRTDLPELLAGIDHFRAYRSFLSAGGTSALLQRHGYRIDRELTDPSGCYRIVCARPCIRATS